MIILFTLLCGSIYLETNTVEGEFIEKEEIFSGVLRDKYIKNDKYYYELDDVLLIAKNNMNLKIGNSIEIQGVINNFNRASNPGVFDERNFYNSLGFKYKIYIDEVKIIDHRYNYLKENLYIVKENLKNTLYKISDDKEASIFSGIVLGEKSNIDKNIKELYRANGIAHILAISGLHIAIVGISIYKILRKKLMIESSVAISVFVVFMYVAMTGFSPSAIRAFIMFGIKMLADIFGRTYDILTAVSVAGICMVVSNPDIIINTGFQLSFVAVLSIGVFLPVIKKEEFIKNKFLESILVSFCINLGTLPILAYSFFEISTYSTLINIFVLPLIGTVVYAGLFAGILGTITLKAGIFIIGIGTYILKFYEYFCVLFSKLPYSLVIVGRPVIFSIAFYYITLFLSPLFLKMKDKRKKLISLILILTFLFSLIYLKLPTNLTITILDVGQGDGIIIELPGNINYLIDGGSLDNKNVGEYVLKPVIKSKGIKKIDSWFITHSDEDHINGLIEFLENYKNFNIEIENIIFSNILLQDKDIKKVIEIANLENIKTYFLNRGDKILKNKVEIECIYPNDNTVFDDEDKNNSSMVLTLKYHDFDIFFAADIDENAEQKILEYNILKKYDILKVAHHGSKNSTGIEFINAINPEISIVSCGENNIFGHPHDELINRLQDYGVINYITMNSGAIEIKTNGEKININEYIKTEKK